MQENLRIKASRQARASLCGVSNAWPGVWLSPTIATSSAFRIGMRRVLVERADLTEMDAEDGRMIPETGDLEGTSIA